MAKYLKVVVRILDKSYQAKVAVYRHVSSPDEITVYIQEIRPVPPEPLVDAADGVAKVLQGGGLSQDFLIEKTYPYDEGELKGGKHHA